VRFFDIPHFRTEERALAAERLRQPQRLGRTPTSHNALIDLIDCLLRQPDGVFAMSTFIVFGLLKFVDGLLEIVSGIEHVLLERVGRPSAKHPES
jgi:hypothetical protein